MRGCKRVEKRADNLFAKLETIRGILDRIAQSQTDKMVRAAVAVHSFIVRVFYCLLLLLSVLKVCAGHVGRLYKPIRQEWPP